MEFLGYRGERVFDGKGVMGRVFSSYADELAAALFVGVPLSITVAWLLHRFVLEWAPGAGIRRLAVLDGLLAASVLPFLYATLSRGYGSGRTLSVIPFGELSSSFSTAQVALSEVTLLNIGGNMALLFLFGALLPLRSRRCRGFGRVATVAALMSVCVEAAQFVLAVGRVSSVDDVLVNVAGALTGALVTRPWWSSLHLARETASPAVAVS
ncbi:VanZ family protein [Streptomyces sp. NPDC059477]|uniref:VanZ family protein n=1 Tax=Streptomyces sp. NPDC059477 TaxID=3346847 RepID=UPI0036B578DB